MVWLNLLSEMFFKVRVSNECIKLNLTDASVFNAVTSALYGGADKLESHLLETAQAYKEASLYTVSAPQVGEPTDFEDGADVALIQYDEETSRLIVKSIVAFISPVYFFDLRMDVTTASGKDLGGMRKRWYDTEREVASYWVKVDPAELENETICVDCLVSYVLSGQDAAQSMLASRDALFSATYGASVASVELLDPIKQHEGSQPPVTVCYARKPSAGEDVDYEYKESFNPKTGVQRLFVPFGARVTLDSTKFVGIYSEEFKLQLVSNGTARYRTEGREEEIAQCFQATDTGFEFHLDDDWKDDVPSSRLPFRDRVDITFRVQFLKSDGSRSNIEISSLYDVSSRFGAKADYLNLLWGCVAAGTKVHMADGSSVLIDEIKKDDCVLSRSVDGKNQTYKVARVLAGTENTFVNIVAEDGSYLRCSVSHPVLTQGGMVRADQVTGDALVACMDGGWQHVCGVWTSTGGTVYTLELAAIDSDAVPSPADALRDPYTFWADGILVGDNAAQAALDWNREQLCYENLYLSEADAWVSLTEGEVCMVGER